MRLDTYGQFKRNMYNKMSMLEYIDYLKDNGMSEINAWCEVLDMENK
jgi:hypothetical protein